MSFVFINIKKYLTATGCPPLNLKSSGLLFVFWLSIPPKKSAVLHQHGASQSTSNQIIV